MNTDEIRDMINNVDIDKILVVMNHMNDKIAELETRLNNAEKSAKRTADNQTEPGQKFLKPDL